MLERSIQLLVQEMDLADSLGADYVVLHTGSASQDSMENARKRAIGALRIVAGLRQWESKLLLENTAGERGDISSNIDDLAEIVGQTDSSLIAGVCIDTCHAFAAGYDISGDQGVSELVREVEKWLGVDSVKLIHLNDSKKGCNSRVDRHEHIGQGGIGVEGLERFVNHPTFRTIPLILETPKKSEEDDPRNLKVVRSLFNEYNS
jgi:deoxyribonuclease-4